MVVLFCLIVGCHEKQEVTQLTAGKKVTLSISTEMQNRMFKIAVPQSYKITCQTTGSSQTDMLSLYVKFGSQPTEFSYIDLGNDASTTQKVGPLSA